MEQVIELSHKEFLKIDKDFNQAAKVADLMYVSDKEPGIAPCSSRTVPADAPGFDAPPRELPTTLGRFGLWR